MFPDVKTVITSFPNIQELIECRTDLYNPSSETDFEHFESKLDIIRMCLGGENSELLNQDDIEQTCSQYKTTEGIKKVLVEELKKTQKVCTKDNDVYSRISTNIQEGTALAPSHEEGDLSLKLEESLKANNITLVSSINTANIYRKPLLLINTQKTLKSGGEVDNNFPSEYFTDFRFNLTHPNENEENYQQNGVKGLFPNFKDEPLFHQLRTEYADFENSFGALRFELPENNNLNITEIKETFPKQEAVMVFLTSKNNIYTPAKEDKSKNHVIIVTDIPFVETYNEKHEKEKISSLVNYNIQGVEGPIFFSAGGGIGGTIQASAEFENNADLYYNTIKEGKYVFNSFGNTIEFTNSNQTNILHNFAVLNLPANRRSSPGLDFNYETSTANPNILTKINNFESGDFSFTNKDSTPNSYLQEFDLFPGSKITLKGMTLPLNLKTSAEATNTFDINYSNYTEALILNLEGYEIHNITSIETKAELQKQGWNAENPELPNYRMIVDNTAIDLKDIDEQLLSIKFKNDVIFNPNLNKHSSGKNQALVYYDARNKTEEAKLKIENFRSIKNEKFNLIKYYKTNDEIFIIDERPGINIAQFTDPAIKKFNFELHGKENIIQAYPGQEITVRSIKAGQTMIDFRGLDGVTVESFNQASSENSTEYSSTLVAKNADGTEVAKIIVNNIKPNQKLNIWQKGKQIQQVDLTSGITINKHAAKKIVNSAPGAEISIINGEELLFNSYTGIEFPELTAEISYYKEKNDLVILGKNKDGKLLSFYITSFGNIEQKYNENNNYHLDFAFGYEEKSLEHIITKFNENKNLRNLNHYYKIEELPNDAIIDNREDQQNEIFVLPKFTDIKFEEVTLQDGIAPSLKITYANATTGVEKSFFVASIALNTFIQVGKDGDKININDIKEWSKKCYDIKNIKDLTNIEEELGENAAQKLEDLSKTAKEEYIEFLNSIQSQYGENTKNLIEKLQLNTKRIYKEYISPILTTAATTTITTPTTTTTTTTTPSTTTTTIPTTTTTTPTTTKTTTIATTTPSTTTSTTTTKKSTTTLSKEVQNIRKIQGLRNNHEFTKYYADGNTFEEIITYPLEGSGKINFYHVKPNQNESLNSFIRRLKQMPRPGNGAQIIGNYNRKTKVLVGFEASNIYRYSPSNPTNIYIINKGKDAEIQIVSDKITSYNIISKPDSNITFSSPKSAISITSSIFDYSKLNFPYKPLIDVDFVAKIQNYSFRFKLQDFYNVQNSGWQNPNFAPHNYKLYLADKNSKKEYRLYGLPQRALNAYSKQIEQNSGETLEGFTGRLASHSAENNNFLGMVYGYHGSGSEKTEVMVGLKDNELYKAKDENLHSYHFINKGNNNKFIANKVQFQEYWFTSEKNSSLTLFLETTNISPPFIATSNNDIAFILKFRDQFIKIFILDYLNNAKKFNFFIEANGEQRKVLDWNRQTFILAKDANILTLERNSEVNAEDLIKNLVTGIKFKDMPTNPQLVTIGNDLCITGGRNTCCINNFNKIKEKFTANNEYNLDLYYGLNAAAKPISQVINEYNQLPAPRNGKRAIEENLSQNSYKLRKPLGIEEKKESYNIIGEGFFENENDEFAHQDSATPRIDEGAMQNDSFLQTLNPFNLMSSAYNYLFNNTASTQNNNQPLLESNSFESNNISHSLPQQKLNGTLPLADLKVKMANISAEFLEGASDYILNHKTRPIELSKPELNGTLQLADLAVKTLNNKFFNKEASPFEELSKKIEKQGKFDKIKVFKPLSSELYEKEKNKILFNEVKERLKLVKNFNQLKELFPEFQTLEKQAFFKENPSPSEDKFNEMKEVLTQAKNLTQLEKTLKYFVKEAKDYISHELNKKPPVENEFEKFLRENKTIKFNEAQEQGRRF